MHEGHPVASLDVKLKDGNVGGIKKFKLFLPQTRNGINEVVVANLFTYLGLLAPRTSLVNVNVDDVNLPYIFQEKASKEFLEANDMRESAIYKFDESLMWLMRQRQKRQNNLTFAALISPVIINNKWGADNATSSRITNAGLNKLSNEFNKSHRGLLHENLALSESELAGKFNRSKQIQTFFVILSTISRADHGMVNHNRRFYYNPFSSQLEPIYYDGAANFLSLSKDLTYIPSFNKSLEKNFQAKSVLSKISSPSDFIYAKKDVRWHRYWRV